MSDLLQRIAQLQSCVSELQAKLSAKQKTVDEQRQRIRDLSAENEGLKEIIALHGVEVESKNRELEQFRRLLEERETANNSEREIIQKSLQELQNAELQARLDSTTKDSTIRNLQMEIDGLILLNDDLQEIQKKQKLELDGLVTECNKKLHHTIQDERQKVKAVLKQCDTVIASLSTKVKESNAKSLLLESEMRSGFETMEKLHDGLTAQNQAYQEWIQLLQSRKTSTSERTNDFFSEAGKEQSSDVENSHSDKSASENEPASESQRFL